MNKNAGPYSNHTLMALSELVRETRRVCFAMERLERPRDIAARIKELQPFYAALLSEITHDNADEAKAARRAIIEAIKRVIPGPLRGFLFIVACAAAAFALVRFGP